MGMTAKTTLWDWQNLFSHVLEVVASFNCQFCVAIFCFCTVLGVMEVQLLSMEAFTASEYVFQSLVPNTYGNDEALRKSNFVPVWVGPFFRILLFVILPRNRSPLLNRKHTSITSLPVLAVLLWFVPFMCSPYLNWLQVWDCAAVIFDSKGGLNLSRPLGSASRSALLFT